MKAMIFAAGLGTRLRPITESTPKPLVEIKGKTLLEISINKLVESGFDEIIINVHHFTDQIVDFLNDKKFNAKIEVSDESDKLLDTGGGLKKASWFFDDGKPFLVHNVDIVSDLDLKTLYQSHMQNNSIATLAVSKRKTSRYFIFDEEGILSGWQNVKTNEQKMTRHITTVNKFAFSGIQVIDPNLFKYFPDAEIFSIVDLYLTISQKEIIKAYQHENTGWYDVGNIEELNLLNKS